MIFDPSRAEDPAGETLEAANDLAVYANEPMGSLTTAVDAQTSGGILTGDEHASGQEDAMLANSCARRGGNGVNEDAVEDLPSPPTHTQTGPPSHTRVGGGRDS